MCTFSGVQIPFEDIPLEQEQQDLLVEMVEANRAVEPQDREFFTIGTSAGYLSTIPG